MIFFKGGMNEPHSLSVPDPRSAQGPLRFGTNSTRFNGGS